MASWLLLRGRCRTCREPVSWMYPVVEIATALVFLSGYLLYGLTPLAAVRILFASALIVLFVTDLQHKILPNVITVPGIVVGFVCCSSNPAGAIR
jgi:leader peptidase (prepilin peptidase)/N-methyltransferase